MTIGLYIHVPFCIRKCRYCDFSSAPIKQEQVDLFLQGLEREIEFYQKNPLQDEQRVSSIFVGGGTPTCLKPRQLSGILEKVYSIFKVTGDAEVTTEANPGTVTLESLKELKAAGFNRLSLGVQSTHQELLKIIGRIHNFEEARQAVYFAREAGFNNLNLDLIFGLPKQTAAHWRQSLFEVVDLQPEHIACYGLQLEEGTPLTLDIEKGVLEACPEEMELKMYLMAREVLNSAGYEHYEISNFAKPGYQSKHNLLYWHNKPYLGLGPAAHSCLNGARWSNVENIDKYVALLRSGRRPLAEVNSLSIKEEMEETVFLALRLLVGLRLTSFEERFGISLMEVFGQQVKRLENKGLVQIADGHLKITEKGLPLANQVFVEFV